MATVRPKAVSGGLPCIPPFKLIVNNDEWKVKVAAPAKLCGEQGSMSKAQDIYSSYLVGNQLGKALPSPPDLAVPENKAAG